MPKRFKIQVENSAPSQGKPARSVKWASPILKSEGVTSIVDLGCGRLRNLGIFKNHFSEITLVDTPLQCKRIADDVPKKSSIKLMKIDDFKKVEKTYDAFFLISVLHILDELSVRKKLLQLTRQKLRNNGFLVIDVPSGVHYYRVNCTPENKYKDGYVMGKGEIKTFYKNYYSKELDQLVTSCTDFKLFRKIWFDKHLIRIWQKNE